jgi:hypothetical protein
MTGDPFAPAPQEPPPPPPPADGENGLGLAGFIVSLAGLLFTCGVLCPVGLILSLFGLRREPRGFAIAGTVIGAVGSLVAMLFGVAVVLVAVNVGHVLEKLEKGGGGPWRTPFALAGAQATIEMEKAEKQRLPDEKRGNALIAGVRDGWNRPLRYELHDDSYTIRSAGADGVFGNADDETLEGR